MPGVPSSKGCEACRKAKKKCDELHPCSRCNRLQTECVGSGQQRFQFKNGYVTPPCSQLAGRQGQDAIASAKPVDRTKIYRTIQISTEELQSAIIYALKVTDVRFDLGYYGDLLNDVPRRLGSSAVLDSAVKALVTSYPYVHSRVFSPDMLLEYGRALRTLRRSLDNPIEARSANTLCAIYLIMICESWLGNYDSYNASHGEVIVCLLGMKNLGQIEDDFEKKIIITLAAAVIPEAIINPRIEIDSKVFNTVSLLTKNSQAEIQDNDEPRPTTNLLTLARFPKWIRSLTTNDLSDIYAAYLRFRNDSQRMRVYLDEWSATKTETFSSLIAMQRSRYQTAYTISITMGLILNTLLRSLNQANYELIIEANFYCDEIVLQSELASCYRPLGAAYTPLCLVIVIAVAESQIQIQRAEALLNDYQADFKGIAWNHCAGWLKNTFESYRAREVVSVDEDPPEDLRDHLTGNYTNPEPCHIM